MKDAGLWSCFLEIVVAAGYKGGPWKGSSHLQSVRDAAADYQALVTPEADALFGVLYEDIARDMKRFRPTVAGSPEHLREIREKALDDLQNLGKGRRIKISRWFSFFDVAAELEERWHLELWLLVFLGIENKWFDNAASSPLGHRFSHDGKDVSSSAAGPCEEAFSVKSIGQARATVKHSNQEIAEMRRNSKNQLHLAAKILGSSTTRDNMVMMSVVVAPVRQVFGEFTTAQKTIRGGAHWAIQLSQGPSISGDTWHTR